MAARADPDGRDGNRLRDDAGDRVGNALEYDREAARLGERHRVVGEGLRGVELLALHLEPTECVDRLWGEPDVSHHGDLGVEDRLHRVEPFGAPFEFHRTGPRAHQRRRVANRLLAAHVIAEPRQVGHHERVRIGKGWARMPTRQPPGGRRRYASLDSGKPRYLLGR